MEHLIKKVEDFRTHVRINNFFAYTFFFVFGANSLIDFSTKDTFGEKSYLVFIFLLMAFLAFYFFKNRRNLPLPMEVTKESMEAYQRKQLLRYLNSATSVIWWGLIPLTHAGLGIVVMKGFSGGVSLLGVLTFLTLLIWIFIQNRIFVKKYKQQYQELGGDFHSWFSL